RYPAAGFAGPRQARQPGVARRSQRNQQDRWTGQRGYAATGRATARARPAGVPALLQLAGRVSGPAALLPILDDSDSIRNHGGNGSPATALRYPVRAGDGQRPCDYG
nr:hypothetical protein [Tanacetum cinerariifolium]